MLLIPESPGAGRYATGSCRRGVQSTDLAATQNDDGHLPHRLTDEVEAGDVKPPYSKSLATESFGP
jgi:hypothetical protein